MDDQKMVWTNLKQVLWKEQERTNRIIKKSKEMEQGKKSRNFQYVRPTKELLRIYQRKPKNWSKPAGFNGKFINVQLLIQSDGENFWILYQFKSHK